MSIAEQDGTSLVIAESFNLQKQYPADRTAQRTELRVGLRYASGRRCSAGVNVPDNKAMDV